MDEAVNHSYKIADSGDTVLLSPACASFDLFKNYEMLGLMKDTSLIAVMGATPPELLRSSQIIINRIHEPIFILLGAGCFYYIMCYSMTYFADKYEKHHHIKSIELR